MRAWFGCFLVLVATLLSAPNALAEGSDAAARAAARKLGNAGIEAYQASDFKTAAEKLDKAYKTLQAPSLGLWSARAFVKNGRLVEAQERYLEVTRLAVSGGDKEVQTQAKLDAGKELEALTPRIPSILVKLEGATAEQVTISIDGVAVKGELVGEAVPIDPGAHKVEGVRGSEKTQADVTIAEGREEAVVLRFDPNASQPVPALGATTPTTPAATAGAPGEPAPAADAAPAEGRRRSMLPILGWIGVGVGVAGIAAGGITGALAIEKKADLSASGECDSGCQQTGRYKNFNTLRTVSTVCFVAGGVVLATGIVVLVLAPSSSGTAVNLRVAPGEVTLSGSF